MLSEYRKIYEYLTIKRSFESSEMSKTFKKFSKYKNFIIKLNNFNEKFKYI